MFNQKRGQITIFIIIGVLLLFSSGTVFFLRSSMTESSLEASLKSSVSKVPLDILPVKEYIDQCLRQVSVESLNYVGSHGGYYNTSDFFDLKDTDRNAVRGIPYWYHMSDCSDKFFGCPDSLQLSLDDNTKSLKTEIEDYVEDNLLSCINDFRSFENFFKIKILRSPKVDTIIRDKDVFFKLNMPIEITNQKGDVTQAQDFLQTVKVDLYSIYDFANSLIEMQSESGFLEQIFLNIMAPYRGDVLPPFYEMKQGKDADPSIHWLYDDVKEVIEKDILQQFVNFIKFSNTNVGVPLGSSQEYDDSLANEITAGFWSSLTKSTNDKNYQNLLVEVEYPKDSYYLSLNDGEYYIGPENMFDAVDGSGMTQMILALFSPFMLVYKTNYDMVVPLVVTITDLSADKNAFNQQGYQFSFALELNIRNNEPYTKKISLQPVNKTARKNLIDDPMLFPDTLYEIQAIDAVTNEPLSGVYVQAQCSMKHSLGVINASRSLFTKLPSCSSGGKLILSKDGYAMDPISFENDASSVSGTYKIPMWPIVEKTLRLHKVHVKEMVTGDLPLDKALNLFTAGIPKLLDGDLEVTDFLLVVNPTLGLLTDALGIESSNSPKTFDEKVENYRIATMLFSLEETIGKGALAAIFPVGTLIVAGISILQAVVESQFGLSFPIPVDQYKTMVHSSEKYVIVDEISELENEEAMVIIKREALALSTRVPQLGIFSFNDTKGDDLIKLIPGNYSVKTNLMYIENFTLPKQHVCGGMDFINKMCEQFGVGQEIENKTMESWVESSDDYNIIIRPQDLYNEDNEYLDIYVFSKGLPTGWFDIPGKDYWERIGVLREKWIDGLSSE